MRDAVYEAKVTNGITVSKVQGSIPANNNSSRPEALKYVEEQERQQNNLKNNKSKPKISPFTELKTQEKWEP